MIAIPLAPVIERHDEQIAALQCFQHFSAVVPPCNRITQGTTQAAQNGGLQQEAAYTFRLVLQNFFGQIIQDKTVAAGKGFDEAGSVFMPPHGDRRELQTGDPSFGAGLQSGDISGREIQAHHPVKKFGGFGGGKAQIGGAQFSQLTAGTQPCQRERRILTGGDQQVHLPWQVFKQKSKSVVDRFKINHMVVIQYQEKMIRNGGYLIEQDCQNKFG